MVKEGKLTRNAKVRVIRDGIVIYTGSLGSLKRFKDDVKEVQSGYDCGLNIDGYNDIKVEDVDQAPVEKTWFPNEYYMYAIVGLGALSLILLIAMIYFIASRKVRHEGRKKKAISCIRQFCS